MYNSLLTNSSKNIIFIIPTYYSFFLYKFAREMSIKGVSDELWI